MNLPLSKEEIKIIDNIKIGCEGLIKLILSDILKSPEKFAKLDYHKKHKYFVGIFALFLFALSISAYKTIHLKKMIFAIAAFGLFAVESFIDYLEDVLPILDTPYIDILLAIISLAILVLFFLAFIKRR